MSNKITGSDLKRLINEAMGLRMETPKDDGLADSELAQQLLDAPVVDDPDDFDDDSDPTVSNVSDDSVPGEALFFPRWKTQGIDKKEIAADSLKDNYPNLYSDDHLEAIFTLVKIANSDYYGKDSGKDFFPGELSDGKIFDFLSSSPNKKNQILGGGATQRKATAALKKYLKWIAKDSKASNNQKAMAASLASKDPSEFVKRKEDSYARPRISFDKKFSQRGQVRTIPRYIKSVFDSVISAADTAEGRIKILNEISDNLVKQGTNIPGKDQQATGQAAKSVEDSKLLPNQKFSSLIIVDFLRQIAEFARAAPIEAGNFFESFLALLFNGTVEGGKYDFEDVLLPFTGEANGTTAGGNPAFISAKFVGKQTVISQSGDTVDKFFQVHGKNAEIMYIIAEKDYYSDKATSILRFYVDTIKKNEVEAAKTESPGKVKFYSAGATVPIRGKESSTNKPKKAKGSGRYVFDNSINEQNLVGTFMFSTNEEIYRQKMEQKFEALKLGISEMYTSLNNLEENLTIYYSSPGAPEDDKRKEKAAEDAQKNIQEIDKNYNENIAETDRVNMSTRKKAASQNESKITATDIKKLIEESFKK